MNKSRLIFFAFLFFTIITKANVIVVNGLTHKFSGVSGQTFKGKVILINPTSIDQRVIFSLNEALYNCETGRTFVEKAAHINSSTTWFNGSVLEKVLAPKEKFIYKFSITIPNDALLKGSYWTTLMVDVDKPVRKEVSKGIGLSTKMRYAIRLLTDVNLMDDVALDFKQIELKPESQKNKRKLTVKIFNESLFIENVKLSLEVYDFNGNKILMSKTQRLSVFPNVCRDFNIDVSNLKKGDYKCIVLADSREEFTGVNVDLKID